MSKKESKESKEKVKETAGEIKADAETIKIALGDDKSSKSTWQQVFRIINKHKFKILGLIGAVAFITATVFTDFQPPELVFVVITGVTVGSIVCYPYAKIVTSWYITDDRKPVIELDPEDISKDGALPISVWKVPKEQMNDIEVINGSPNKVTTKKAGNGIAVEHFQVMQNDDGTSDMYAEGTWVGSKSGMELMKDVDEIQAMKENLEPLAMKGYAYEIKWPFIMRQLSEKITNAIVHEFQGVTQFKGKEMHNHVEDIISEFSPEKVTNDLDEKDMNNKQNGHESDEIDIEAMAEMVGDANE